MTVRCAGNTFDAMQFFCDQLPWGSRIRLAYKLSINEFRGNRTVHLLDVDKDPC